MSKASRTNTGKVRAFGSVTKFLRSRSKMFHVSKPLIKNPKFDPESKLNTELPLIVAPIKGRTYVKPVEVSHE